MFIVLKCFELWMRNKMDNITALSSTNAQVLYKLWRHITYPQCLQKTQHDIDQHFFS